MPLPYDASDQLSIERYAKGLLNKSLRQVLKASVINSVIYSVKNKGGMGQLLEKYYFQYEPNNHSAPDFQDAELELKSTPLKRLRDGKLVAKERLVLNIINYETEPLKSWLESSFWVKNKALLLMFYLHQQDKSIFDLVFKLIGIWKYPQKDLRIIKHDWETIVNKIKAGRAHEISEGDTLYLAACVKGKGGSKNLREQSQTVIKAPQRAFSLKKKYLDTIILQWSNMLEAEDIEAIVKTSAEYKDEEESFEDLVVKRFQPYIGKSIKFIRQSVGKDLNPSSKNFFSRISLRILGVKAKKAEEFEKAEIVLRTVRLKNNNVPKEDVSFPYFKYREIVEEEWETSAFRDLLTRRFFFVIFKYDAAGTLILKKVAFWAMPYKDLKEAQRVWDITVNQILSGDIDNLPKKSESHVCHVRPHGRDSEDVDVAPNGEKFVKKSFWLNASYISEQLARDID